VLIGHHQDYSCCSSSSCGFPRRQYYGKSSEALPGVTYPGFRDNCSTLNTKTGYKKKHGLSSKIVSASKLVKRKLRVVTTILIAFCAVGEFF